MALFTEASVETFEAGTTIAKYLSVRLSSGVLALAGASDQDYLGQCELDAVSGDMCPVRLTTAQGTAIGVCSEAITLGATLYAAASGKLATSGTIVRGTALNATAANNELVTFLPAKNTLGNIARSALTEDALAAFDVMGDLKGADGADLALSETAGDFFKNIGTNQDLIDGEATINETEVSVGIFTFTLPECYVSGGDIKIRAAAGVVLAGDASLTSATIDFEAYKQATDGTVGSDLVATAATAIDATIGNKDFTVTATGLVAGDKLNIKMTTSVVEAATGTGAANARITRLQMLCDIKG